MWDYKGETDFIIQHEKISPVSISLEKYLKLESSLIVVPATDSLVFLNNLNGRKLTVYKSENVIRYVSEFDLFTKSLYIIESNKILRLELKVL